MSTAFGLQRTLSPVDGRLVAERPFASGSELDRALDRAVAAQAAWRHVPLPERMAVCERFGAAMLARKAEIAEELSWQIGRPVSQTPGEVQTCVDRAQAMIAAAETGLADIRPEPRDGFDRYVRRVPLGVVFVIAPWNYPYLTAVNTIVPALLAGNAVILKHAAQTQLCGERFAEALRAAGLPDGLFAALTPTHGQAEALIGDPRVAHVAFTGSVAAGHRIQQAAAGRFVGVGLELGGKDPAYVRADADVAHAAENLVDGAFFNSGQSCCGIERIYVHEAVWQPFLDRAVEVTRGYRLGDPLDPATTLGPVVKQEAADFIRDQVEEALRAGATGLIDAAAFAAARPGTPYLAPQILVDVDHSMRVMSEETFGPVVGIMKVRSDEEAIGLMNDSAYGLTASVWTRDAEAARRIGDEVETGTVFLNRCDHLDPSLAWTGVKDSGRGWTLGTLGYEHLTRPKSYHLRLPA
ncbi:aldehyde dehydrogenase family protein [Enterovirga sp.]|jgi:acyl-CoA reductase-like NAD-dependent aldehyde dehydrogenase|uniref:aldehyde dehydrogenase family protein n=1 Tax=Enterovirga sp. TaxID=2026350 RepID=UPI00260C2ADC|nr:aldehyde dehydrogenase family protein [Enterovirga sp.]MDB5592348.1 aldehyde dehydrogenase [Enterovirga sp.]